MLYKICVLFLLFICYSILGWMIECLSVSFHEKKLTLDRGFLIGPYCPIYGYGGLFFFIFLEQYKNTPLTLFILAAVGSSVLEYITSYLMEKIFKTRWWDYSDRKFNIEGRIYLGNIVAFGLLGVILVYIINPYLLNIITNFKTNYLIAISILILIIFLIDNIITFTIMTKLRLNISNIKQDQTTEIDKQVKDFLLNYNFFLKHLFKVFPRIKISLPTGDKILSSIKETLENIDLIKLNKKQQIKELKQKIKTTTNKQEKKQLKNQIYSIK